MDKMRYFILITHIMASGMILFQLYYFTIKNIRLKNNKIEGPPMLFLLTIGLATSVFIVQKLGIENLVLEQTFMESVLKMNIYLSVVLIVVLIFIMNLLNIKASYYVREIQRKNRIIRNQFKFILYAILIGIDLFLIMLINYKFLPNLG